jgi:adenine-specific DNA-methyltransferase
VRICQGDCLDVMAEMEENSVDLIATDPPYYRVKDEPWDKQWDTPEGFIAWIGQLCEQWQRILKPNGSLYVFASPKMAARVECEVGRWFNVLNHVVWRKPSSRHNQADATKLRGYFPQTERIIFAEHFGADNIAKGEAGYTAKCDELRGFVFEPLRAYLASEWGRAGLTRADADRATNSFMSGHYLSSVQWALPTREKYEQLRAYANANGQNHGGDYLRREYEDLRREYEDLRREYEDLRRPFSVTADVPYTDVWDFATVQAYPGKHPCEKPVEMMRHIVLASSREGDTVLDPFMGSGSTGCAAVQEGRDFIGIELDAEYCEIARRRIEHWARQPVLEMV